MHETQRYQIKSEIRKIGEKLVLTEELLDRATALPDDQRKQCYGTHGIALIADQIAYLEKRLEDLLRALNA